MLTAIIFSLSIASSGPIRILDDTERAKGACREASGKWACDPAKLAHFNIETETKTEPVEGADVAVEMLRAENGRGCPLGMRLAVRPKSGDARIDWSKVSIVVDGRAHQAVPGFAKKISDNLNQRPSVAPVGAAIIEDVLSLDSPGECLSKDPEFSITLDVPMTIGVNDIRARGTSTQRWVPVSASYALSHIPDFEIPSDPGDPGPDPGNPGPIIGGLIGGGVGGLLGGAGSTAILLSNAGEAVPRVEAAVVLAGLGIGAGAVIGVLAGVAVDHGHSDWAVLSDAHWRARTLRERQDALVAARKAAADAEASSVATKP